MSGIRKAIEHLGVAVLLAMALAGEARAAGTPTSFVGMFQNHTSYGDCVPPGYTPASTATFVLDFNCELDLFYVGDIQGKITVAFPTLLPEAVYDAAGTHLIFAAPFATHVTTDLTWTTRDVEKSSGQLTVESFDDDEGSGLGESHCRFDSATVKPGPGQTVTFHGSADCSWSSLPIIGPTNSPNPQVEISSISNFSAKSGNLASPHQTIVTTYSFGPPTLDLTIDHLEVVQVVQHPDNSIPWIADKPTVVRVFANFSDSANPPAGHIAGINAKLHGFRGGTALSDSPLSPINPGGVFTVLHPNSVSFDRAHTGDSLNFLLPAAWTEAGDLTLQAILNPDKTVGETDYTNDNSELLVFHFREAPLFTVAYLPVCYKVDVQCPSNAVSRLDAMARKLFPLDAADFLYIPLRIPRWIYPYPLIDAEDESKLLAFLRRRYELTDLQEHVVYDQLMGWLPDLGAGNPFPLGSSDPKWLGSTGRVSFVQDTSGSDPAGTAPDFSDASFTLAHEIGHNLGLRHTDKARGGDGCKAVDANSDFAAFYTDGKATIHEVGFDTKNLVAVPATKKDLMSYCSPPGSNIWISPFDYGKLIAGGLNPQVHFSLASTQTSDVVVVTGTANRDGAAGVITSVDHINSFAAPDLSDPTGNYCLRFSASNGTKLSDQCFTLTFEAENHGQAEIDLSVESFAIKAPFPAETAKIALVKGSIELASVRQSAHAPTISITAPHSGDSWSGVKTITWNAADADGDPLTFAILTSPDNGSTWLPVVTDLETSSYSIESAELSAASQTLFKVLASDGFDTTAATVGPLTIAPQPFLEATPELEFGITAPGSSADLSVLLTNRGGKDGHIVSIDSSDPDFTPQPAALPLTIPPAGQVLLTVHFAPTGAGEKTGALTIGTDDPQHSTLTVLLSGRGCAAGKRPCIATVPAPSPSPTQRPSQ